MAITAVVWYLGHDPSPALSPRRILVAFLIGGVLGVLGASLLEYWLVRVVVVSLVGLIPFIWLWRRGAAGGVLPRRRPSVV